MNLNRRQVEIRRFLKSLDFIEIRGEYPNERYDGYVCEVFCPIRNRQVTVGVRKPSILDSYTVNYPDDELETWPDWTLCEPAGLIPHRMLVTV